MVLQLIKRLHLENRSVATIKHAHHPLVVPQCDGHRMGAVAPNITVGPNRTIIDWPHQNKKPILFQLVDQYYPQFEVIFIEGWREYNLPTILTAEPPNNWEIPNTIVACTNNVENWRPDVPRWSPIEIVQHILETIDGGS